jgi:hypothetical protein
LRRLALSYLGHGRVLRALIARDPEAARVAMHRHIQWARTYHLAAYDWNRDAGLAPDASVADYMLRVVHRIENGTLGAAPAAPRKRRPAKRSVGRGPKNR